MRVSVDVCARACGSLCLVDASRAYSGCKNIKYEYCGTKKKEYFFMKKRKRKKKLTGIQLF